MLIILILILGYFGHAVELCNEVLNCAAMSQEIAVFLDGFEGWGAFVENKLEPINAYSNPTPTNFDDDEEEEDDYSYDPENYYMGMTGLNVPGEEEDEEEEGGQLDYQQILDVDTAIQDDAMLDLEIENDLRNLSMEDKEPKEETNEQHEEEEAANNEEEVPNEIDNKVEGEE